LFFEQIIDTVDDSEMPHGKRCRTDSYRYHLQSKSGASLIRWEYDRYRKREEDSFPLAHVHVHASLAGRDVEGFHIATGRVPVESVFRHLIADWGVDPKRDDWEQVLDESTLQFYERRKHP
jgi:hypothetical protein